MLALGIGLPLRALAPASDPWGLACLGLSLAAYVAIQRYLFRNKEADRIFRLALGKTRGRDAGQKPPPPAP
jgi:hypothetical protein